MQLYMISAGDERRAEDVNQLTRTLRNALGILADDQDEVGRLVLPNAAAAPGSPSEAQEYFDTVEGIRKIRNGSSVWMPYLPIRQVPRPDPTVNANYYPDIDTLGGDQKWQIRDSREITLSGAGVLILVYASVGAFGNFAQDSAVNGAEQVGDISLLIKRGSHPVFQGSYTLIELHNVGLVSFISDNKALIYYDEPGPGSYTYTLNSKLTWSVYGSNIRRPDDLIWNTLGAPFSLQFVEVEAT